MSRHAARRHTLAGGIATACATVLLATPAAQATQYTWDAGGAGDRSWGTATNWKSDVLPTFNDQAEIIFSSQINSSQSSINASRTIGSLTYDGSAVTSTLYLANDSAEAGSRNLTLGSSTVAPSITMAFDSADQKIGNSVGSIILANNLTIANNSSNILTIARPITATGFSLTKTGTGTLSISAGSSYDGGTFIKQGSIALGGGDDRLLATSSVTLGDSSSGTTGRLALGSANSARNQTLGGLFAVGSGGKVVGAHATNNSVLTLNITPGTDTYDGTLGGTGTNENKLALTKQGSGVLVLTNANTYTGGTTISGGTLSLGNGGTTGSLSANSAISVDTGANLTINRSNAVVQGTDFSTSGITGAGSFSQVGAGKTTLNAANSYTGKTTVAGGTLQLAKQVSLYNNTTTSWTATKIDVQSGATLALNVGGTGEFTSANLQTIAALGTASGGFENGSFLGLDTTNADGGSFTYTPAIANPNTASNVRGLTKLGTNTLVLGGTNSYTGGTTISGGTLALGSGGVAGSLSPSSVISVGAGANLTINRSNDIIQGTNFSTAAITGAGSLSQIGAGKTTLTAANSYTGGTTISAGTLSLGDGGITGSLSASGPISVASGANLTINRSNDVSQGTDFSTAGISGAGSFNQIGAGKTTLKAANTYTGGTIVSAGTLSLGNGGTGGSLSSSGAISVASGANLTINRSNGVAQGIDFSTAGITGAGTVKQIGAGTTILNANNTYSGGTTITGGELRANNSIGSTGTGTVTVGDGSNAATLGGHGTIANGTNAIIVNTNATITAGASSSTTGKLTTGAQVWKGGGQYTWKLANRTGNAGVANGWDQLAITTLNLTDLDASNKFKIVAVGTGAMALQTGDSFQIATYTGTSTSTGVTSLASLFSLDVTQIIGQTENADVASNYGISFNDTSIMLSYNGPQAAPEPGVVSLVGLSGAALLGQRRRRRCVA